MTDHTPGEWTVTKDYKVNRDGTVTPGTEAVSCSVCNKELETREYTIELTKWDMKNAVRFGHMKRKIFGMYRGTI